MMKHRPVLCFGAAIVAMAIRAGAHTIASRGGVLDSATRHPADDLSTAPWISVAGGVDPSLPCCNSAPRLRKSVRASTPTVCPTPSESTPPPEPVPGALSARRPILRACRR